MNQIVNQMVMTAREVSDQIVFIRVAPQSQSCELQSGYPAFRTGFQVLNVLILEGKTHYTIEKSSRFVKVKSQISHADLCQFLLDAQAAQWHRWDSPGDDHHVHSRREVIEKEVESLVNFDFLDGVVIVQYQSKAGSRGSDVIDQRGQQVFNGWVGARFQGWQYFGADVWIDPL